MRTECIYEDWLQCMRGGVIGRRPAAGQKAPEPETICGGNGSNGVVQGVEPGQHLSALGRPHNGVTLLRVTVGFDEARLQHPVQKYFELGKVIWRLVGCGVHLLRSKANAMAQDKEASA